MFPVSALIALWSFQASPPTAAPTAMGLHWYDVGNASIPMLGFNIYAQQGPCPPTGGLSNFGVIATAGAGNLDNSAPGQFAYTYVVRGLMPGVWSFEIAATAPGMQEGPKSNCAQGTIGSPVPPPAMLVAPTNLTAVPQ